ncbi:hypothetical protein V8F33_014176 [Rhypophila sp. PSN 637]
MRHSDNEDITPTGESKEGKEDGDNGEYTAPAAEGKEGGNNSEYTPLAAERKRAATYNKEGHSPVIISNTNNDLYEDIIIYTPAINEQQKRSLIEKHLATPHSERLGEALECGACVASATPVGEIQGIKELLQHTIEKHPLEQAVTKIAGGKRKRHSDGEHAAPTNETKEGKVDGDNGEYTRPTIKRKRAATHDIAHKEGYSPVVIFNADNDLCEDVIIYAPTINGQQRRSLTDNHIVPSAILDPNFLRHVDPALLAPQRPAASAH